ncbi:hypothetical protein BSL78_09548 [Apostichopus japonicus]|uniref:Uncharacterized protein n=1 Tax=Stichopus japonicus TaxID=307972 RepID=A0A2G8KZV3_STIJA|nr:hypothetical protein BSL78_09548 [Apostichopus japonicus]
MAKLRFFVLCGLIWMTVCVDQESLPNETVDIEQWGTSKAEDLHLRKIIETNQVKIDRLASENRKMIEMLNALRDELHRKGDANDVTEASYRLNEDQFSDRSRREANYFPTEKREKNHISSNTGYNECYLCPAGPIGSAGPPGSPGKPGRDGLAGTIGTPGMAGAMGSPGAPGLPGRDGRDGTLGSCSDTQSVTTPTPNTTTPVPGVIFVRWGKTTCPSTSQFVYSGLSAGSYFMNKGGSVEILCLPSTPQYSFTVSGNQEARSPINMVEYSTGSFQPFQHVHNHEMPCSVCMAPRRMSKLVIPARNTCPSSEWTLEYSGYLQSARKTWFRTATICLDQSRIQSLEPRVTGMGRCY